MLFGKRNPHQGEFGSCCKELRAALSDVPKSLFHVSPEGVFYLSVGVAETEEGVGWFDQAVIFCPFCGRQLQDPQEIAANARDRSSGRVH
jgi:hypothetical protein